MSVSDTDRRQHLIWAIQHIMAHPGGTVQVAGPYDAVVLGKPMSHGAHVLMTILFLGLWLPIWLLCAASYKRSVYHLAVNDEGQLTISDATRKRQMGMTPQGTLFYA